MPLTPCDPEHTLLVPIDSAEMLQTTTRHLKRLAARGELRPVRVGGKVRYRLADLHRYIDELAS